MVPWPIALLSLFYGVIAAASAATAWKAVQGLSRQPVIWPLLWCAVAAGAMCGLALLRPWGRTLAVVGFTALCVVTLAVAGVLVTSAHPLAAIAAAVVAGLHIMAIRYLQRAKVKALFTSATLEQRGRS
jgi:hypothetical protein